MAMASELRKQDGLARLVKGLVGRWKVELTIRNPDGSIVGGKGDLEAESISGGHGVHSMMNVELKGMGLYEEQVLWGYDQKRNEISNLSVTSDGRVLYHNGIWKDDTTMELRSAGLEKGGEPSEHITISLVSPTEVRGNIVVSVDNQTITRLDYVLNRV